MSSLCPQCEAKMVQRTAARGVNAGNSFWGCSRYPERKAIVGN
ncbi:MAG: topoisomerase DNA-binding C4 zinc finger domain-containing protein [Victivallaceae bacterium]